MALSVAEVNHNSFSVHVLTENPLELSKNYLEECKHRPQKQSDKRQKAAYSHKPRL